MSGEKIRQLNDGFRQSITATGVIGGEVLLSAAVFGLSPDVYGRVIEKIINFSDFNADDDPRGEHNFGSFDLEETGQRIFWKIDYYDPSARYGSEDPSDAEKTLRVLSIMLADAY